MREDRIRALRVLAVALPFLFSAHALGSSFPETNTSTAASVAFGFWSDTHDGGRANADVDRLLDMLQRAGVGAIQLNMQWPDFEDAAQYHFERFDYTWAACAARRIRIVARVGDLPGREVAEKKLHCKGDIVQWLAKAAKAGGTVYKAYDDALASYTANMVAHYSALWAKLTLDPTTHRPLDSSWDSRITWDLWNEPNWPWGGPPKVMPDVLLRSLATMVDRIRQLAPNDTIIAPSVAFVDTRPVSPHGYGNTGNDRKCGLLYCQCRSCDDSQCVATRCYEQYGGYLEALFRQGLLRLVDGVSIHPYRPSRPESVISPCPQPPGGLQYWPATYATVRNLMNRYGGQNVMIVTNEWGWADSKDFGYGDITAQRQADYLSRMMLTNLSYQDDSQSGIPVSNWYQIADDGALPAGYPEFEGHFGISDTTGKVKASYHALQTLTQTLPNATFQTRLLDDVHSNVHLLVFRAHGDEAYRQVMAAWDASNVVTITHLPKRADFAGTYLLDGTPLYIGQNLVWNGGNHGSWSGAKSWTCTGEGDCHAWSDTGFQAVFDTSDEVEISRGYTVSGIQFNASATVNGRGALRLTPGGGNVYVAAGERGTLGTVEVTNSVMRDPASPGTTIVLNDPATSSLRKCGWGTLSLGGDNTFRGSVIVGEGLINLGSDHALGESTNSVTLSGGGIDLNGRNVTSGAFLVKGDSSIINSGRNRSTFSPKSFNVSSGSLSIIAGSGVTISAPIDVHRGGALIFAGASSINTGRILLGGGALYQNAAALLTADLVQLTDGGTLGGTGRVVSDIRVTNGYVSPGLAGPGSIGTLSIGGDITFMPPSAFDVDLGANGASDVLVMTSARRKVALAGTLNIRASGNVRPGARYDIITNASSVEGAFTIGSAPPGVVWSVAVVPIHDHCNVVLNAG